MTFNTHVITDNYYTQVITDDYYTQVITDDYYIYNNRQKVFLQDGNLFKLLLRLDGHLEIFKNCILLSTKEKRR